MQSRQLPSDFTMTLAKNGELLEFLKKLGSFDDTATQFYSAEMLAALEYLHALGVIHRDLKPENVLLSDSMHILVSDFGSAKLIGVDGDQSSSPIAATAQSAAVAASCASSSSGGAPAPGRVKRCSFVGTAQYVSPEVLNGVPVTPACDYWALGCIVYQMLAGLPPFRAANDYLIFKKINECQYTFPLGFPEVPQSLVAGLLKLNPEERLGSETLGGPEKLKQHPFFTGVDWEGLCSQTPPKLLPYLPGSGDQPGVHSRLAQSPAGFVTTGRIAPGLDDEQLSRLAADALRGDVSPAAAPPRAPPSPSLAATRRCGLLDIDAATRKQRLQEQTRTNEFHRFVENNLILKQGLVDKKKGLFARRRMFLLTEGPHIYYVDPASMELKGQIPFSAETKPEALNFKIFFVHTVGLVTEFLDVFLE